MSKDKELNIQFIYFKPFSKPKEQKIEPLYGIGFGTTKIQYGEWLCDDELVKKIEWDSSTFKFNLETNELDSGGDFVVTLKNGESKRFPFFLSEDLIKKWVESFKI